MTFPMRPLAEPIRSAELKGERKNFAVLVISSPASDTILLLPLFQLANNEENLT